MRREDQGTGCANQTLQEGRQEPHETSAAKEKACLSRKAVEAEKHRQDDVAKQQDGAYGPNAPRPEL